MKILVRKAVVLSVVIASLAFFALASLPGDAHATSSNSRPEVELYVTSWCPYCTKAKAFFDQRDIEYQVYDIEKDSAAARRKQQLDTGRGVPFAVINGTKVSGWSAPAYQAALDK
jgi:glutaredoxin